MDKVQYKVTPCGEYYGLPAIDISLERVPIEDDDPLLERANDTRTPFEQYDAGEKYIYVDLSDLFENSQPEIYSRDAYHNTFLITGSLPFYSKKNYKINFEDWCKEIEAIDTITREDIIAHIEQQQDPGHLCEPYLMDYKEGLSWDGQKHVFKADFMGGVKHDL